MTIAVKRAFIGALAAICLARFLPAAARAQDAEAVLTDGAGPYQSAFDSFQKEFAQPVAAVHLPGEKPAAWPKARVIVAFGGQAALQEYPDHPTLIVCLAPGLSDRPQRGVAFTLVDMKPPAETMLERLKRLQPSLKRLAVLWNSEDTKRYLKELKRAAAAQGMEIVSEEVADPRGIPDALRALRGKADALWLAPDPSLVTPESFQTIKQFSWDNAMPFYAPTGGLAGAGAAASVSVSPQEAGRQAAELARRALSGERLSDVIYPANTELTVNVESAAKAGLSISSETLKQADRVIQ